jgi:hypothetical protein
MRRGAGLILPLGAAHRDFGIARALAAKGLDNVLRGSVAIRPSPFSRAKRAALGPPAAITTGGLLRGRS